MSTFLACRPTPWLIRCVTAFLKKNVAGDDGWYPSETCPQLTGQQTGKVLLCGVNDVMCKGDLSTKLLLYNAKLWVRSIGDSPAGQTSHDSNAACCRMLLSWSALRHWSVDNTVGCIQKHVQVLCTKRTCNFATTLPNEIR